MKVDIIMPAYNPGSFIVEAVESCLNQSHKDSQLTVIDDCSTQNLDFLMKKFPKINLLRTPNNLGPAGARNYGISKTDADFISFLDSDDVMDIHKLANSMKEFQKDKSIGMTCGNYRILANGKLRAPFYNTPVHISYDSLLRQNLVASGSVTIKREIFNLVGGFNEKYWIGEDYDLWLKISETHSISYINKVLYFYRVVSGGGSLTQRSDIQIKHLNNLKEIKAASIQRTKK